MCLTVSENNAEEGYSTLRTVQVTNHAEKRPRSAQHRKPRPSSAQATKGRPLSANQPRALRVPPASSTNDRVLDYVNNSGNPRVAGRAKVGRKTSGTSSHKSNNANSDTNNTANHTTSTNTDTGESANEVSVLSSHKNSNYPDEDSHDKSGSRSRSSSSDRSRSRSESGSRHDKRSRSNSSSPYRSPRHNTETHLKHSSNPALKKWLRRKDKELRKKKKEERAQQLADELEKQEEKRKRETLFKDSDKKVKEWMVRKRKEATRLAREDRRRLKEEEKEKQEREAIQQQYNSPFRLSERPQTAPSGHLTHHDRKLFIPIIRPERPIAGGGNSNGTHENATGNPPEGDGSSDNQKDGEGNPIEPKIPRPPLASKFVYKRPVSGRVRLMKLQQEKKADAKRTELEKMLHEKRLAEEKAKKMRISYDQWLIKKRSEDYEKRQEAARQRALAKSDPELERIVPEVARRRIENIQRGKRRVTTGDKTIDSEVNKSFGGGDFHSDSEGNNYRLEVSGSSFKQRPSSAKASLNPKVSKSPRRPQSAHPRVKSVMDEDHDTQKNAFKLPFPAENGAPKHVLAKQEKLFSQHLTHPELSQSPSGSQQQQIPNGNVNEVDTANNAPQETTQKSQGQTEDNSNCKSPEDETSSSFFVTEGNIDHAVKSEANINATSTATEEQSQEGKENNETDTPLVDKELSGVEEQNLLPESKESDEWLKDKHPGEGTNDTSETIDAEGSHIIEQNASVHQEENETGAQPKNEVSVDDGGNDLKNEADTILNSNNGNENNDAHDENKVPPKLDLGGNDDQHLEEPGALSADGATGADIDGAMMDKKGTQEKGPELEVRASRISNKRVSFQEETQVYEPSDLGDSVDDEEFYNNSNHGSHRNNSEDFEDDFNDDVDKDYDDEDDDDEAEDERGNYFGDETPRDDENDDF